MPDLRRLHYFLTVAEERSFTRAAEKLHVAQPALSRQVRLLEEDLGATLLHRTTHEFELTEAGAYLVDRGRQLLESSEELWRAVRTFGGGDRGRINIVYGASAGYETAPRLLAALAPRHSQIVFTTAVEPTPEILDALRSGRVDLGIVRCPPAVPELEAWPLRHERQGVLLRRSHRLAEQQAVAVADLEGEKILLHPRDANPGHFDAVVALFRANEIEPAIQLRTISFDLAQTPISAGESIAVIGEAARADLTGELVWVPIEPPVRFAVALVARRYGRPPAVDRVVESAVAVAEERGWLVDA